MNEDLVLGIALWHFLSMSLFLLLHSKKDLFEPTKGDMIVYLICLPLTIFIFSFLLLKTLIRSTREMMQDSKISIWLNKPLKKVK